MNRFAFSALTALALTSPTWACAAKSDRFRPQKSRIVLRRLRWPDLRIVHRRVRQGRRRLGHGHPGR